MNDVLHLILAVLSGVLLGAFFFGGLWWTINRSLASAQPAVLILILSSFLLRTTVAVGGFYIALQAGWQSLVACMLGFLVSRVVVTRVIGVRREKTATPAHRGVS
jgi:F1F0 ATPase subunit 2